MFIVGPNAMYIDGLGRKPFKSGQAHFTER